MRCYNKKCALWKKTICNAIDCKNRIALKDKALSCGAWWQSVTVHEIGTSLGIYLPKEICNRKKIEAGSELAVKEKDDSVEFIIPPLPQK